MKTFVGIKAVLIFPMIAGLIVALFLYSQVFSLFSKLMGVVGYNWISVFGILIVGVLLTGVDIGILVKDLISPNAGNKIGLLRVLKFFVGGFIGCYGLFSIMGGFVLIVLMLAQKIFKLG